MSFQTTVKVLHEVPKELNDNDWTLCLQYVRYQYENNHYQEGYRFIWRRPNGSLQAARGQARIPSTSKLLELVSLAMADGWGAIDGNSMSNL